MPRRSSAAVGLLSGGAAERAPAPLASAGPGVPCTGRAPLRARAPAREGGPLSGGSGGASPPRRSVPPARSPRDAPVTAPLGGGGGAAIGREDASGACGAFAPFGCGIRLFADVGPLGAVVGGTPPVPPDEPLWGRCARDGAPIEPLPPRMGGEPTTALAPAPTAALAFRGAIVAGSVEKPKPPPPLLPPPPPPPGTAP